MYKCLDCGMVFEEAITTHEGGYPEEPTAACPYCKSIDLEEVFHCIKCGEWFADDDMIGSICKDCLEKMLTNENAIQYGDEDRQEVTINGFMAWLYRGGEIEDILEADFRRTSPEWQRRMVKDYCMDSKYDFSEFLEGQDDDDN